MRYGRRVHITEPFGSEITSLEQELNQAQADGNQDRLAGAVHKLRLFFDTCRILKEGRMPPHRVVDMGADRERPGFTKYSFENKRLHILYSADPSTVYISWGVFLEQRADQPEPANDTGVQAP